MKMEKGIQMEEINKLISAYLGPGGKMEANIPGFKYRKEQLKLANEISRALEDENFIIAEVGTGVGKTFAYLLPSIIWASEIKEKLIISTRTKALQQQIINRDLPDLQKVLDMKFKYAEAKGRDNFLCWNKYMQILGGRKKLAFGEEEFITSILKWAETTSSGDRKELDLSSELMKYWPMLAADRNNCQKEMCKYRDKCFRMKMKKRLEKADIIVANHALLLSDVLVENSILPSYEYLVVDEAHTFIRESFDKLSYQFSRGEITDLLRMLYQKDKKAKRGYLLHLYSSYPQVNELLNTSSVFVEQAIRLTGDLFNCISAGLAYGEDFNYHHILSPADRNKNWFQDMINIYLEWQYNMNLLVKNLEEIASELSGEEEGIQVLNICSSLQEISDKAFYILEEHLEKEDKIIWIECIRGRAAVLCSSAIYTGDVLSQHLYSKLKGMVMVSATLAVENNFDNYIKQSGLQQYQQEGRVETLLEGSPFNYQEQACIFVVSDMPDPSSSRFNADVNQVLDDIFEVNYGHSMVLFTSRKQLQEASNYLRPRLTMRGIDLLVQYEDGEFGTIISKFTSSKNAVLMGLETFWEGIDLKGDYLKCLIIVKLPFRSPSDPYCSAWDRYYKRQRQSSFQNFMLPDTVVRFKQGIGRLIRSEEDRGSVVVLDTRLINKNYGKVIQNSVPIKNIFPVKKNEVKEKIKDWL